MKKLFCDEETGRIIEANILKDGRPSKSGVIDRTTECVIAMLKHLTLKSSLTEIGMGGYEWTKKDTGGKIMLVALDTDEYEIVKRQDES